uniref:uncharacterized protein n=1 Tax=Semicossyphus pulcher TaxID=241346 RepID=UPI0037E8BB78
MTSPKFVFYLTCLVLGDIAQTTASKLSSSVRQLRRKTGESLTLQCVHNGDGVPRLYWYKQTLGQELKLISALYKYGNDSFHNEFKNNQRFSLDTENGKNHLTISDLRSSDSATYYCISCFFNMFEILETIIVDVKGSGLNVPVLVQQSGSETIQPGGSVTLNCTVQTGTCDGEHSVYWFKDSEESHPGLIYTHGGRNDQCERKRNTATNTCVYKLPMTSLNRSHVGIYYCAVVSCGHILFGKGTKLDFEDKMDWSLVLVYLLSGALIFMTILVVVLAFFMNKMNKRNSFHSQEASSTRNIEDHRDADNLFYAALSINRPNTSRRQRNDTTNDECVYSGVNYCKAA